MTTPKQVETRLHNSQEVSEDGLGSDAASVGAGDGPSDQAS